MKTFTFKHESATAPYQAFEVEAETKEKAIDVLEIIYKTRKFELIK